MSIKTTLTSALVAVMAAGSLLPMASAANARDFDRQGRGKGQYGKQFNGPGKHSQFNRGWRGRDRGNHYAYGGPRHRHRDHSGRNLAIGAAAAILGIAIASEVARDRDYRY